MGMISDSMMTNDYFSDASIKARLSVCVDIEELIAVQKTLDKSTINPKITVYPEGVDPLEIGTYSFGEVLYFTHEVAKTDVPGLMIAVMWHSLTTCRPERIHIVEIYRLLIKYVGLTSEPITTILRACKAFDQIKDDLMITLPLDTNCPCSQCRRCHNPELN